ncbi:triose-phosphate isomerase family protein [Arthrobacter pigmenti]
MSTKMYLGYRASLDWLAGVRDEVTARPALAGNVRIFVAPSFPVLESASRILDGTGVLLAAQNSSAAGGALTGEVSPDLLAELGVGLVEIGHAERRRLFGEDDAVVAEKTAAVAAAGMTPLLCIGEHQRQGVPEAVEFCFGQVDSALGTTVAADDVVIAYEPVWAIGAAEPAPAGYVNDVVSGLRTRLAARVGRSAGTGGAAPESATGTARPGPSILYGGSAGPGLLPRLDAADGLFLGRFAHDPANLGAVLDEVLQRSSR